MHLHAADPAAHRRDARRAARGRWPRAAALLATPLVFFCLGVSRLLVLAVPAAVVGSYVVAIHAFSQTLVAVLLVAMAAVWATGGGRRAGLAVGAGAVAAFAAAPILGALVGGAVEGLQGLAGHAGHRFADEQGAWAILPAFQVGLFAALWIAFAGRRRAWRRALAGLGGVVLAQATLGVPVDELAHPLRLRPPTSACSAAGRWCCPRRRLGGCSFFPRPARPLPRRPRRARCRKPADTSREHPQGKRRTRAGCHRCQEQKWMRLPTAQTGAEGQAGNRKSRDCARK